MRKAWLTLVAAGCLLAPAAHAQTPTDLPVVVEAHDFQDGAFTNVALAAVDVHLEVRVPLTIGAVPCGRGSNADGTICGQEGAFHENYVLWQEQNPGLFEIAQHGLTHIDAAENYTQIGFPTREQQAARIARGLEVMTGWGLPQGRPMTFAPAFSAANPDTLRALEQLGFRTFSQNAGNCSGQTTPLVLFCDSVPICERTPQGGRITGPACVVRSPQAVIAEVNALQGRGFVFVNYHIQDLYQAGGFVDVDEGKVAALRNILQALKAEAAAGHYRLATMDQVATNTIPDRSSGPSHVTGADFGGGPNVVVWSTQGTTVTASHSFFAYNPAFGAGVRVAGSQTQPIVVTAPGRGGGPDVRIWNVATPRSQPLVGRLLAYPAGFTGGVYVAMGKTPVESDLLVTGAGESGGPHVRFFDLSNPAAPGDVDAGGFFAFAPGFTGGVRVAACDLDGVPGDEIVAAAGPGGGPQVRVFKRGAGPAVSDLGGFLAYPAGFTGGVYVACGDVDDDGRVEIVTGAGAGGGPQVRLFERQANGTFAADGGFLAYAPGFTGGVRVGVADSAHDGHANVVVSPGPGGGPQVRTFRIASDGAAPIESPPPYFAYDPNFTAGLFVAGVSAP